MSIADWFSARERRRYTEITDSPSRSSDVRDGAWIKCDSCKHIVYEGQVSHEVRICPHCGHHFDLPAAGRIRLLLDEGTFSELDEGLTSKDPLGFGSDKPYAQSLEGARERSGLADAIVTGRGLICGHPVVFGAMDFRFIGASMGSVVGEKVARAFEIATEERLPVIMVTASGGARMQEGMLSLMQMAKTAAAARTHSEAGLPYISVLTNPTFGGVTASFAVLADVILAEPGAHVGFTGARVIEQTIREKLPKGFQTSESLLEHGMIDEVVPRGELKQRICVLLDYLVPLAQVGA